MCSPVEGPRRSETSHFLITSLELKCHVHIFYYLYMYIYNKFTEASQHIKYSSKSLDVVQSLYFGSKLPSSGTYK